MNLTLQVLAAKHDNIIRLSESYKPFPKFGNRLIAFTSFIFFNSVDVVAKGLRND